MGDLLNQFGAYIALATAFVVGFVYLFSTAKKSRQDIIRQDNADLRASNDTLRMENGGLKATLAETKDTVDKLQNIATQTPAVTRLIEVIERQQKQTTTQHMQVIQELSKLTGEISNLAAVIKESKT